MALYFYHRKKLMEIIALCFIIEKKLNINILISIGGGKVKNIFVE